MRWSSRDVYYAQVTCTRKTPVAERASAATKMSCLGKLRTNAASAFGGNPWQIARVTTVGLDVERLAAPKSGQLGTMRSAGGDFAIDRT